MFFGVFFEKNTILRYKILFLFVFLVDFNSILISGKVKKRFKVCFSTFKKNIMQVFCVIFCADFLKNVKKCVVVVCFFDFV